MREAAFPLHAGGRAGVATAPQALDRRFSREIEAWRTGLAGWFTAPEQVAGGGLAGLVAQRP